MLCQPGPTGRQRAVGISVLSPDVAYYTVVDNDCNTQFVRYTSGGGDTWSLSRLPAAWKSAYLQPGRIEVMPGGRRFVGGYWGIIGAATLPTPPTCAADLDGDRVIDFADYLQFLNLFESGDPRADQSQDGVVDSIDFLVFLNLCDAGC